MGFDFFVIFVLPFLPICNFLAVIKIFTGSCPNTVIKLDRCAINLVEPETGRVDHCDDQAANNDLKLAFADSFFVGEALGTSTKRYKKIFWHITGENSGVDQLQTANRLFPPYS